MSETGENPQSCPATKKNGEPCTANPGRSGYCIGHSPDAQEARRRGGKASSGAERARRLLPARLRPVLLSLEEALEQVRTGKLDPKRATAMASLARAIVVVFEAAEMEERLRKLETLMEGQNE